MSDPFLMENFKIIRIVDLGTGIHKKEGAPKK